MPLFLQFLIRCIFAMFVSLVIITMVLYAGVMLTPPEARARLYVPPGQGGERTTEARINVIIEQYHLDDPYLVQYGYWVRFLLTGSWGYSPTLCDDVLSTLLHRTPATLAIVLFGVSWNLIGDGLVETFDPTANFGGWTIRNAVD